MLVNHPVTEQGFWEDMAAHPDDFSLFCIFADYCEDQGKDDLAYALRWCAKHKRSPRKTATMWAWGLAKGYLPNLEPAEAICAPVFTLLTNQRVRSWPNKKSVHYKTIEKIFLVLASALRPLREMFEV